MTHPSTDELLAHGESVRALALRLCADAVPAVAVGFRARAYRLRRRTIHRSGLLVERQDLAAALGEHADARWCEQSIAELDGGR